MFLAMPYNMWNLSSPTRDQTHVPCIGSYEGSNKKYTLANTKINFKNIVTKENWSVSQSLTANFTWERIDENNFA